MTGATATEKAAINKRIPPRKLFTLDWYYYLRFNVAEPKGKEYGLSPLVAAKCKRDAAQLMFDNEFAALFMEKAGL